MNLVVKAGELNLDLTPVRQEPYTLHLPEKKEGPGTSSYQTTVNQ